MKLRPFLKSVRRIVLAVGCIAAFAAVAYWLWRPGSDISDGSFDRGTNGIWLGHGWLGDDGWFRLYRKNPEEFRSETAIRALFERLKENRIRYLYPHLCPASSDGSIARNDPEQTERFLTLAEEYGFEVIPWVGGPLGKSADPASPQWREGFVRSVESLFAAHPALAGIQLNIEPMPSGNSGFLELLDELRPVMGGRSLEVAAYPPPSWFHPFPQVHWETGYLKEVAQRCDRMAVMMYDTALTKEKLYIRLMRVWTHELLEAVDGTECRLLLGLPAYEDAGSGYHHPDVEHLAGALRGIHAGLSGRELTNYLGCAIYCEWEMTPEKWSVWQRRFLGRPER
ncbi:MAG: glycoside hydrolase family 18 protein [Lentisphaeria bacterium]|nr:glycoside hydrolase family 18 protein [Lentisphaeria bacterium]